MKRMYSKEEIEAIAQAAVSGGTKIYKHQIGLIDSDESETYTIYIYTTSSTKLTSISGIFTALTTCLNAKVYNSAYSANFTINCGYTISTTNNLVVITESGLIRVALGRIVSEDVITTL